MFKLTESVINSGIENASKILSEVYPTFQVPNIWSIKVTNATSYWANIGRDKKVRSRFGMHISRTFEKIPDENLARLRFETCMIHELIHTIPGCNNHGNNFKRVGRMVKRKYPQYDICRCVSAEEFGVDKAEAKPAKYLIRCEHCKHEYRYQRKPKYAISEYKCSKCGSDKLKLFVIKIF